MCGVRGAGSGSGWCRVDGAGLAWGSGRCGVEGAVYGTRAAGYEVRRAGEWLVWRGRGTFEVGVAGMAWKGQV